MDESIFIRTLFERAMAAGFEACEADLSTGDSFSVAVRKGEITDYSVSSSFGLGFRGLYGGKMGYASTQVMDEAALDLLINGARENAEMTESEDQQFIFEGSGSYPRLNLYNPKIDAITAHDKIALAKAYEKACLSVDSRVKECRVVQVMTGRGTRRLVNTKGLDVSTEENYIGAFASVIARDGGRVSSGSAIRLTRDPDQLDIKKEAGEAVRDAVGGLEATQPDSGARRVVLRRDAAASILATFSGVFSADLAQKGMSLLKGREGEIIASPALNIVDDPLNEASPGATPFDGEGVAARRVDIVSGGRLNTLLHNLKTAHKQNVTTTASASKPSYASPLGVAAHSMHILPGEMSVDQLIEAADDGVYITDLQGLHSGANQISGDFSLGAKGFLIEGGKLTRSVNQMTVAGNFYQLMKDVLAVADNLEFAAGAVASPDLLIGSLSVAGK